jgi:hypothetical protein
LREDKSFYQMLSAIYNWNELAKRAAGDENYMQESFYRTMVITHCACRKDAHPEGDEHISARILESFAAVIKQLMPEQPPQRPCYAMRNSD